MLETWHEGLFILNGSIINVGESKRAYKKCFKKSRAYFAKIR
jgi:hypothetical protein